MRSYQQTKWELAQLEHRAIAVCRADATFCEARTGYEYKSVEIAQKAAERFITQGHRVYTILPNKQ